MPNVDWTNKNTLQNLIDTIHARLIKRITHYTVMPEPTIDLVGDIVQYIGDTDENYTNAYFYKCNEVEDESTGAISYAWRAVEVQNSTHISEEFDNSIIEKPDGIYSRTVQIDSLPVSSEDNLGTIYEYIGESTPTLTKGYFYQSTKLIDVDTGVVTYEWRPINVQEPTQISAEDNNAINERLDGLYVRAIQVDELPEATTNNEDYIFQYTGETTGTLTNGYFYKCVMDYDSETGEITYDWKVIDVQQPTQISEEFDNAISELADGIYAKSIQMAVLPEATALNEGVIYEYIGATTFSLTNGYFYKNVGTVDSETGETTYAWTAIDIQEEKVKHWVGTRAELTVALANDEIEEGTIILITDEPDVDDLPTEDSTNLVYSGGVWLALQEKENLFRYATMPEANEELEGVIAQFIGETTADYVNGYFYQCVEVTGSDPAEYEWVQKSVQPNGDIILDVVSLPASNVENAIYRTTNAVSGDIDYFFGNATNDSTLEILTEDERIQFDEIPAASVNYLGRIIEYTGVTTLTATNGFFYECVEVAGSDPTEYEWVQKNVQPDGLAIEEVSELPVSGIKEKTLYFVPKFVNNTGYVDETNDYFYVGTTVIREDNVRVPAYNKFIYSTGVYNGIVRADESTEEYGAIYTAIRNETFPEDICEIEVVDGINKKDEYINLDGTSDGWELLGVEVDNALSTESANPVENRVIAEAIDELDNRIDNLKKVITYHYTNLSINKTMTQAQIDQDFGAIVNTGAEIFISIEGNHSVNNVVFNVSGLTHNTSVNSYDAFVPSWSIVRVSPYTTVEGVSGNTFNLLLNTCFYEADEVRNLANGESITRQGGDSYTKDADGNISISIPAQYWLYTITCHYND